jgi:acetoin utilization deacetylase AcuC-like enzyme
MADLAGEALKHQTKEIKNQERLEAIEKDRLERERAASDISAAEHEVEVLKVMGATEEEILRIHTKEHLEDIKKQSLNVKGGDAGDGESPFGHGGYEIAALSAGGAIAAIDAVLDGTVTNAYALIRPPGHHARRGNGMGFCIFSNASIATALASHSLPSCFFCFKGWTN